MKLRSFKELMSMTKEGVDAALAPMRARKVKAQAELEMAKLDERMAVTDADIQEICSNKDIDFDLLIKKLNEHDLTARRKKQFSKIIGELFPE